MANIEHLTILAQGINVWNNWRAENRLLKPDFSESDFSKAYLSGAYLGEADFTNSDLSEANLTACC